MNTLFPTWIVEYWPRRPTLTRPLTGAEIQRVEVGQCADRERALAAFRQRFPPCCKVASIYVGSATGMS